MFKKIALSLCFTLFLGLLTACSPDSLLRPKSGESPANQTRSNAIKIGTPVALPPAFEGKNNDKSSKLPNGLNDLRPAKGINVDALFSEELKDDGKRFERLENAVVDLRKEFDSYKPSIVRLAAVESDIQNLIKELEVLLQETPTSDVTNKPVDLSARGPTPSLTVEQLMPDPPDPEQAKEKSQPEDKPPEKKPSKQKKILPHYEDTIAENLRAGEHAEKVRLVLDTNKNTEFSMDLDNEEKLIIIELPSARWIGETSHKFKDSKLLDSYSVEPLNNKKGSLIVIALKKATKILRQKRLEPDASNPYHRIYFDLSL